jgi:hypothetical protein
MRLHGYVGVSYKSILLLQRVGRDKVSDQKRTVMRDRNVESGRRAIRRL